MVKNIFILNSQLKVIKVLNIKGDNVFYDDTYTQDLSTGTSTFEFSTNVTGIIEEGNYVMFYHKLKYELFQIVEIEEEHKEGGITSHCYAEGAVLELLNGSFRGLKGDMSADFLMKKILDGTRWELGYCSESLKTNIQMVNIDKTTQIWDIIQTYMGIFNYEIDTRVTYSAGKVIGFYIDLYDEGELGKKTYKRFEYGRNVSGIVKKKDLYEWCTAIIIDCQCEVDNISFKQHGFSKGNGSDTILAETANDIYNAGKPYIYGVYDGNEVDGREAVDNALKDLKRRCIPKFDYDVTTALTYQEYMDISLGDTVRVNDSSFNPPLLLEARISKIELSFSDRNNCKCTLSNYRKLKTSALDLTKFISGNKKLTEQDIINIKKYLAELDIDKAVIGKIINSLLDKNDDPVIINPGKEPGKGDDPEATEEVEDTEDYKQIKLSTISGGLWLGDKRIYDLKSSKPVSQEDSKVAQQYKDALAYYKKFSLGTRKDNATLASIMSDNNKYKIGVLVRYWCGKFGLDTRLVYAMIMAESSGNPYCDEAAYGLMQCEKSCYFGRKYTIKFLDGSTKSFTPSYSTMQPGKGGKTTINGVSVDKNISNQIMFGCYELRKCAEACHYNVFATLMAYNFGQAGMQWCVCEYIKDKYGLSVNSNKRGIASQSTAVKEKYYKVLDTHKAPFASYRQKYKNRWHAGTPTNIEYYLRWYKPYNGSLPYFKDKKGNKIGYGVIVPSSTATQATGTASSDKRKIIVDLAKKIVSQHKDQKIATYNQVPRTVNFDKPVRWRGTHYGMRNPIVYDCSSFVSCCYLKAGLNSVYNRGCYDGSLVAGATAKDGWKMWKLTTSNLDNYAKPGDIIMVANKTVTTSNMTKSHMSKEGITHHTIIYCGKVNGKHMIAHSSKWAYWPEAIRYEDADYYIRGGKSFILRPWDLAKADGNTTKPDSPIDTNTVSDVAFKGLPGARAKDYDNLPKSVTVDGRTDNVKFPSTTKYVFCHFGVGDLNTTDYINLLKDLQHKYPKKPIFVAKEYYVNSSYSDAATVNSKIDTFNAIMKNYCNKTKYVIFLDISKGLVDSSGKLLTSLSSDGFSFKDEASQKKYYENVKKYILNISKGEIRELSAVDVTVTLLTQKIHTYSKPVKSLTIKLPKTPEDSFYSRITFSTDSSTIKFNQPPNLYLAGDHCKNGAFTPKKSNKYIINVFRSVDNDLTTKKYYGNVTSLYTSKLVKQTGQVNAPGTTLNVRKGAGTTYGILGKLKDNTTVTLISKTSNNWYKIKYKSGNGYVSGKYIDNIKDVTDTTTDFTNYKNFKYRKTFVKNAESFYKNKSKFTYNNTTPFKYSNPKSNIANWKTGGKIHLDDKFLMQLLTMGYSYDTMDIENKTNRNKATDVSWALPYISSEANLAKYFVEKDWVLDDIDYAKFSNIEPGDILFWDSDNVNNNAFMGCSHTSICVGKDSNGNNMMIEAHPSGVIRKVKISDINVNNLLFVGRINLNK